MAESFGRLLLRYRVIAGLSQEKLGELAGISTNAISALERGLSQAPHRATLDLLIAGLKLDHEARREIEDAASRARARRLQSRGDNAQPHVSEKDRLNNLPPEFTTFVDRETEVAEIKQLVQSYRLVTVVGAGGAGKTRCARQVAGALLDDFADGVWLVELALISELALIPTVIGQVLNVRETPERPLLDTLLVYLKRKHLLLVLDNCEHLIDEASNVATAVLRDCPNAHILATCRQSLAVAGERVYRIPSLPVPSPSEILSLQQVSQYGAVRLFSDRAASADDRFTLTIETAPHIADICRRLDGIPLAIELAAARVRSLSAKQLAQKLDERFRVLTRGDRNALPRHQTMRALIDWSYDLLSEEERRLFRKLSIFAGGFTIETAAAVCADGEIDDIVIVDLLSSLVDKSLVQVDRVGADMRYHLLESTRQYAREKLRTAGEEETMVRSHARAFLRVAEHLQDAWDIKPDREWLAEAQPELENFRAALRWAFDAQGDVLLGQRLVGALRRVWLSFSAAEGWRWVQAARQRVSVDTPSVTVAALDLGESVFAYWFDRQNASRIAADLALARYRDLKDSRGIGQALLLLGRANGDEKLVEQALEMFQELGDRRSIIIALTFSAVGRILAGDIPGARQRYREAFTAARAFGAEQYATFIALSLGEVEFRDGNAAAALRLAENALADARAIGDVLAIARAQHNMAAYLVSLRRFDEARAMAREAVTVARDARFFIAIACALQRLAAIGALHPASSLSTIEDRRRAARILGYVDKQFLALDAHRQHIDQHEYEAMKTVLLDALGEDELVRLAALGAAWSEDQAIAEAMLI